jgi:hypothetical protein
MLLILFVTNYLFANALKSKNFIVYYREDSTNAVKICNYLEQNRDQILNITGGNPPKPYIFIEDMGTMSNGYSDPTSKTISIFNYTPEPDFHFGTMKSWWRTVSVHEYTHHVQLSNIDFPASLLRLIFGKMYLPNMLFLPGYMHEGIAVYNESNFEPDDGRLNEGYFDAYLKILNARNKLRQGVYLNHDPVDYPQGEIVYLMGSEFTEFIAKKYGEQKLKEYYTTIGMMPFTVPLIDVPALLAFKKPLSSIWREWQRDLRFHKKYFLPLRFYVDRGYYIKYLRNFNGKIYYVKTNYKRLSWNDTYCESVLCVFDPKYVKIEKIYTGDISLPPVVSGTSIYFGISDVKKGNSNISFYGLQFTNAIVKIEGSGKPKYLLSGRIRAFDVSNDTIFYAIDETEGSSLWKYKDGIKEKIAEFKDLKIQQVKREGEDFYFLAQKELEGNQIYRLSEGRVEKVVSLPFQIGYFEKKGKEFIFPGNYNGKWSLFTFDTENQRLKIFDDPILAYYPALDSQTVYYVTVDVDGEYIKTASIKDFTDFEIIPKNAERSTQTEFVTTLEKTTNLSYFKELLYPDLILPVINISSDYPKNLYNAKISIEGIQLQGHSPLNLVEYSAMVNLRELRRSTFIPYYNGIPATSISFSISGIRNNIGLGIGHILYVRNYGYWRQINLYGELFPWSARGSFSTVLLGKIYPDLYQTYSFGLQYESKKLTTSYYHSTRLPIARTLLISGEFGVNYYHYSKKIEHVEDLKMTLPLVRINWGNDAIIHFFYERNFLTLELVNVSADSTSGRGVLLTLDHLMSILNGNFKVALRTGLLKKFGEPVPYLFITMEPASFNFSKGMFRKRWILRELTGGANLL